MPRARETPTVTTYFTALQKIFALEAEVLTGVIPHLGERGRNDEERFRSFLARVLPKKYTVGTGFIVCSDPSVDVSSQTDVVIADEVFNTPLHRELSALIYPIETVYATIEVKGRLESRDLVKICADITKMRTLAKHRWYVNYEGRAKDKNKPNQRVVEIKEKSAIGWPAPRSFVFAYTKKGWPTADRLREDLESTAAKQPGAHIHGLAVLSENWYFTQEAFAQRPTFSIHTDNSLMWFFRDLLQSVSSLSMREMSIGRYLKHSAADDATKHRR
jgi:hypothetical protein